VVKKKSGRENNREKQWREQKRERESQKRIAIEERRGTVESSGEGAVCNEVRE
jgi:hypothetical protein